MRPRAVLDALAALLSLLAVAVLLAGIPSSSAVAPRAPAAVQPHAELDVEVQGPGGRAVAGASVRVFTLGADGRYSGAAAGATSAAGHASLTSAALGAAWVLVDARGLARRSAAVLLDATPRRLAVSLEAAHRLAVTVRDEAGAAVEGATVLAGPGEGVSAFAVSGPAGQATLDGLGAPPWRLRVLSPGHDAEELASVAADVTVTLRRSAGLDVEVLDPAGKPASGATVLVTGPRVRPARTLVAGADGHARASAVPRGTLELRARAGALVSRVESGVGVEPGEVRAVTLRLEPGRQLRVVVTEGDGEHPLLVAGADVTLVEGGLAAFPLTGRTGTLGTVDLGPFAPGPATVTAAAEGFVPRQAIAVPDPAPAELRVALERGATLRGSVVDEAGAPVEGAEVEVIGSDPRGMPIAATAGGDAFRAAHFAWSLGAGAPLLAAGELGVTVGPVPPIPGPGALELAIAPLSPAAMPRPWSTDPRGEFVARPVPPGRVRALVRHVGHVEVVSDAVELAPGAEARVRIVLPTGGALEGAVTDTHGLPVAGARVALLAVHGTRVLHLVTADDGTFAATALPDRVLVSLSRPGAPFDPVLRRELALDRSGVTSLALVLPEPRAALEVEVEDTSGRPVAGAQVTFLSVDPERPLRRTTFADRAGRVELDDAVGLALRLVVEASGYGRFTEELPRAPERHRVVLARGLRVEGRVTAVRGRRDLAGARVVLVAEGIRRVAYTDPAGRYAFTDVPAGPTRLLATHPDHAPLAVEVTVAETGHEERAFEVDAVDLADPASVEGRVVDAGGEPVARATVTALGRVGDGLELAPVVTDAEGRFRLGGLPGGSLVLEARAPGRGVTRSAPLELETGGDLRDVTLTLEARGAPSSEPFATGDVAVELGEAEQAAAGIPVVSVAGGSEAERAGLLAGDRLVSLDGRPVATAAEARRALAGPEGTDVVIELTRTGGVRSLRVRREPSAR